MTTNSANAALEPSVSEFIRQSVAASDVWVEEQLQALWSGQGQIVRIGTNSQSSPSCVLKQICPNPAAVHPRGWDSGASFLRKKRSYQVERRWYESYACRCTPECKVPQVLGIQTSGDNCQILLEDLSPEYPLKPSTLTVEEALVCLDWLAAFHARFLSDEGSGLWEEGCYWHLNTRQDEYARMAEGAIKDVAQALDERLNNSRYQTLVHGDAKLANFCFNTSLTKVAAVDFQYVGKGCGIRDVVYFLGSCLSENDCEKYEVELLNHYFDALSRALEGKLDTNSMNALQQEWRSLYAIAWCDFYRFLLGWMPTHQKINSYTVSLSRRALRDLKINP